MAIVGVKIGRGAGAVASNTAVGASAMASNSTGANNTAFGYQSLLNNTANNNVAYGFSSLKANTSGTQNTGIGQSALFSNTTASQNTAVGFTAMYSNTTGASNVAIGESALTANTTASYNTAVGYQAGYAVTTGAGNQLFGYSAGSAITTGAKNVIIGSYQGSAAPISATGNNYIVLSDGDGNVRQTIDSSGNLGLGVTPSAWLSSTVAVQLGNYGSLFAFKNSGNVYLNNNSYTNSAGNEIYLNTAPAGRYRITDNVHVWYTAPSGTAGNAISFTQAMTLDASGDFLLGATSAPANGANARNVVFNNPNSVATYVKISNAATGATASDGFDLIMGTSSDAYLVNRENGPMIFLTNATERMRIDSSGNVGIGTNSPVAKLHVSGGYTTLGDFNAGSGTSPHTAAVSFSTNITSGQAESDIWNGFDPAIYTNTGILFCQRLTSSTRRDLMFLHNNGNVGIGTNSPTQKLHVAGAVSTYMRVSSTNAATGAGAYYVNNTATWLIGAGPASGGSEFAFVDQTSGSLERMRIDSSGRLLVNATTPAFGGSNTIRSNTASVNDFGLYVQHTATSSDVRVLAAQCPNYAGDDGYLFIGARSGGDRIYIRTSGNVQNANNSYGAFSDAKIKENVTDATLKLEKLNQVRIVNFNLKGDTQKQIGVIAQEIEQIFPGMVDESPDRDKDGNDLGTTTKSVKYSVFVPMLIKAMQEQTEIITTLTSRITALENK